MFEGLFENLSFQRLLAQEPMKFANLVLQSPILRSRHDLFPTAGRGQAALRHQPTPGEQLVWRDAMPTSHQAYRHTRLEGLFDHANLLRGRPAPTTLNRRDELNAIGRIGHRHGCMPHTCQVGDRVRSVRGLSHRLAQVCCAYFAPDGDCVGPLLLPGFPGILDESCWRTARFWSLMSEPVVSDEGFAAGPLLLPGLPGIPAPEFWPLGTVVCAPPGAAVCAEAGSVTIASALRQRSPAIHVPGPSKGKPRQPTRATSGAARGPWRAGGPGPPTG